jgi:hypothetical protein
VTVVPATLDEVRVMVGVHFDTEARGDGGEVGKIP